MVSTFADDPSRIEVRVDTPEGRGSFWIRCRAVPESHQHAHNDNEMTAMRTWHCIGLAPLIVLGVTVATSASTFADRFTFTRPPAPESVVDPKGGRLNIDITTQ